MPMHHSRLRTRSAGINIFITNRPIKSPRERYVLEAPNAGAKKSKKAKIVARYLRNIQLTSISHEGRRTFMGLDRGQDKRSDNDHAPRIYTHAPRGRCSSYLLFCSRAASFVFLRLDLLCVYIDSAMHATIGT